MIRLRSAVEASLFIRRAESLGGSGVVVQRGDPERGSILLLVSERGEPAALLERMLAADGEYRWQLVGAQTSADPRRLAQYFDRRRRNDPDLWLVELDIAPAQRFIAETIAGG